jgi:hypothetical protein
MRDFENRPDPDESYDASEVADYHDECHALLAVEVAEEKKEEHIEKT